MLRFAPDMFRRSLHKNVVQGAWRVKGAQNADNEKSLEHDMIVKLVPFGNPAFHCIVDMNTTLKLTEEEGGPALTSRIHNLPPS